MRMWVVHITSNDIPDIRAVTFNEDEAVEIAKNWASEWDPKNAKMFPGTAEPYFSQEEDGSMEMSVTVTQITTGATNIITEEDLRKAFREEMHRQPEPAELDRLIVDISDNYDNIDSVVKFCIGRLYK